MRQKILNIYTFNEQLSSMQELKWHCWKTGFGYLIQPLVYNDRSKVNRVQLMIFLNGAFLSQSEQLFKGFCSSLVIYIKYLNIYQIYFINNRVPVAHLGENFCFRMTLYYTIIQGWSILVFFVETITTSNANEKSY
ncbi:Hypothetical_protein [Hexamita inflata]|uniref:Hypothetical_protein n=1 Tax=Hexamita inflata TaxID=28002 RepID=A0AA86R2X2_9EUKA|nr:Hypothetical protein HINF_LOCUS52613 [Hexamita inflata]